MTKANVIPATPDLLEKFYGKPPIRTAQSIVVTMNDEPVAVSGVYIQDHRAYVFADISPTLRPLCKHLRELIRCSYVVIGMAMQYRMPVLSIADPNIEGSERLLKHLGFTRYQGDVYQWLG